MNPRKPPAPYRPQPVPKVLQRKIADHPTSQNKGAPVAPPVYRPQPLPKVLQRKTALERQTPILIGKPEQKKSTGPATAQLKRPANLPLVNRANVRVAQGKPNSNQLGLPFNRGRAPMMSRPTLFRGTVQRAAAAAAVERPARWYFDKDIPKEVQGTLKTMVERIPDLQKLCSKAEAENGLINVSTKPATRGEPRALFKGGVIYVNHNLPADDMVNCIVFELTNASRATELRKVEDDARAVELIEHAGARVQGGIMKQAQSMGLTKTGGFSDMFGEGGRWETPEGYLADQKKSGHTARYEPAPAKSSRCFLTSACVLARGLPDDCDELSTLRSFRDNYIMSLPGGPELVLEYYQIAPGIIDKINEEAEPVRLLDFLYEQLVLPAVKLVRNGEYEEALTHYRNWVLKLKNEGPQFEEAVQTMAMGRNENTPEALANWSPGFERRENPGYIR